MQYSYRCTDNNRKMWWYKPHSTAHSTFILHVHGHIFRLCFNICSCETIRYVWQRTAVKNYQVDCRKYWRVGEWVKEHLVSMISSFCPLLDWTEQLSSVRKWDEGGGDMQQKATPGWIWALGSLRRGHGLCTWGSCSTSWATGAGHFYDIWVDLWVFSNNGHGGQWVGVSYHYVFPSTLTALPPPSTLKTSPLQQRAV